MTLPSCRRTTAWRAEMRGSCSMKVDSGLRPSETSAPSGSCSTRPVSGPVRTDSRHSAGGAGGGGGGGGAAAGGGGARRRAAASGGGGGGHGRRRRRRRGRLRGRRRQLADLRAGELRRGAGGSVVGAARRVAARPPSRSSRCGPPRRRAAGRCPSAAGPSTKVPFVEPVSVSSMPPSAGFSVAWRLETRGSTTTTSLPSIRPTLSSRSTSITRPASAPSRTMMRTDPL